jgi:hypothetical protein
MNEYSTYLLLDTAMMAETGAKPWTKVKRRSGWLLPLYDRPAWAVSPVIVDIEAAHRANRIGLVTDLANQMTPQLHTSFIDTYLSLSDLADHLRRFTYFIDEDKNEFTLRLADCVVLPWLAQVLTASQWTAIHGPILRWRIHDRNGNLRPLPGCISTEPELSPLTISDPQLRALNECHEPEQLMANLRKMRFGHQWADTPHLEIELAEKALSAWKRSGQSDRTTLLIFARGVFDTKGMLLQFPSLHRVLEQRDIARVRIDLQNAVATQISAGA